MKHSNQAPPVATPKRSSGSGFPCAFPGCLRGPLNPFPRASHLERHRTVHEWVNRRPPCGDVACESQRSWTAHLQRCGDQRCKDHLPPELYLWYMHRVVYCLNERMVRFLKLQRYPHHHHPPLHHPVHDLPFFIVLPF